VTETWIARTTTTDTGQLDGDASLVWDTPFAILNNSDVDVIEIREMYIEMAHGLNSAFGYLGPFTLRKITAIQGGRAEEYAKHDSGNADLPSQVSIVRNPDWVTISDIHRAFIPIGMGNFQFSTSYNEPRFGLHTVDPTSVPRGTVFKRREADTQPIVLREGEGVALYCETPGSLVDMRAGCQLRTIATGECYTAPLSFSPGGPGRACAAIFNGSGSGIVLEVLFLQVLEEAEKSAAAIPKMRLLVGPMDIIGGDVITPRPYDSGNKAIDAGVLIVKNAYVRLDQTITEPYYLPQLIYEFGSAQLSQFKLAWAHQRLLARLVEYRTPTAAFPFPKRHDICVIGKGSKGGAVLRKGEGIAMVWGSDGSEYGRVPVLTDVFPTGFSDHDFVAIFNRSDAEHPDGTEAGYQPGVI